MSYWDNFYKNFKEEKPSDFARFIFESEIIGKNDWILDIGCGNGRDAIFFKRFYKNVFGVDSADLDIIEFECFKSDIQEFIKKSCCFDVVYSRFFFHSIPPELTQKIIEWNKNWIVAEFRVKEDIPLLFKDHERYLVDAEWFKAMLEKTHDIHYFQISKGWSKYMGEDPLLARVIAKRRS